MIFISWFCILELCWICYCSWVFVFIFILICFYLGGLSLSVLVGSLGFSAYKIMSSLNILLAGLARALDYSTSYRPFPAYKGEVRMFSWFFSFHTVVSAVHSGRRWSVVWFVWTWVIRASTPCVQQVSVGCHSSCTSRSDAGGATVNCYHRSLCPRQLPCSLGSTRSSKIHLVLDGDGVMKKRKEEKRDGVWLVLLFTQ